jgi:enoyl-CoA hydratase
MPYANILVEQDGGVAVITLNRPKVLNALNGDTMNELADALDSFERDDAVRCTVLTGNDRAFAAGADVGEMAKAVPVDMLTGYRFQQWDRIRKISKPIIAAVRGFALGGRMRTRIAVRRRERRGGGAVRPARDQPRHHARGRGDAASDPCGR